jgi:hypothetical protein
MVGLFLRDGMDSFPQGLIDVLDFLGDSCEGQHLTGDSSD